MNVGMYNVANTSLQESSLEMTLTGLKMEKYFQLFTKKGIKFDTFVNMTEEDLAIVGITNEDDINTILDGVSPLKHLYKDITEPAPYNLELLLGNNVHHLRTLLGLTILLRRKLTQKGNRPKNTLMDVTHSSASAVATLTEALLEQLDLVEEDLTKPEFNQWRYGLPSAVRQTALPRAFLQAASYPNHITARKRILPQDKDFFCFGEVTKRNIKKIKLCGGPSNMKIPEKSSSKKWIIISSGLVLTGVLTSVILYRYTGRSLTAQNVSHFLTLKFR